MSVKLFDHTRPHDDGESAFLSAMTPQLPVVSIGVPVYNEQARIRDRLQNLAGQTYTNLEFCISDNGSTDSTIDQINEFATCRKMVRIHQFANNMGAVSNFVTTAMMATGRYFVWAAADDKWHPEFIEKLVKAFERLQGGEIVMSSAMIQSPDGKTERILQYNQTCRANVVLNYSLMRQLLTGSSSVKSERKFNLFFYGMYRTATLQKVLAKHPKILFRGDRILPSLMIACGGGCCLEELLFTKTRNAVSYAKRAPEDELNKEKRSYYSNTLEALFVFWLSPIIPLKGKVIASVVLSEVWIHRAKCFLVQLFRFIYPKRNG
jgi:glycosyltransferase involved in cell wall biosynthesis